MGPTPLMTRAGHVHGDDGLGGWGERWPADVPLTDEPAGEVLSRLTAERPGQIDLVTVGPLSTVAAALRDDPGIAAARARSPSWGGRWASGGNALRSPRPTSPTIQLGAAEVVAAPWGGDRRPLLVGLDVTARALLGPEDLAAADAGGRAGSTAGRFLAGPLEHYAGYYTRSGQAPPGWSPCHDLVATMAVVDDELITEAPTVPLAVDTGRSAAWGATVADLRPVPEADESPAGFTPWRVALDVDVDRFRATFRSLVAGPA